MDDSISRSLQMIVGKQEWEKNRNEETHRDNSQIEENSISKSFQLIIEEGKSNEIRADKSELKENVPVCIVGYNEVSVRYTYLLTVTAHSAMYFHQLVCPKIMHLTHHMFEF